MAPMILVGYLLALVVGAVLGVLGAGGATITVPIFVYLFSVPPKIATVLSLGVVGAVGLLGVVEGYRKRELEWGWALKTAAPSMLSVWLSRHFLIPLVPDSADFWLMIAFAFLVAFVARAMLKNSGATGAQGSSSLGSAAFMLRATGVGVVTGVLGAGGGFLIVPMLTEWARLPFKRAAATSLLVIVANSAMGLYSGWSEQLAVWYPTWGIFGAIAAVGLVLGRLGAGRISQAGLKRIFAWFLVAVSVLTLVVELKKFI